MKHPRLPALFALVLTSFLLWCSHAPAQLVTPRGSAITDSKTGLSYRAKVREVSAAYTVTSTDDHTILANASGGAFAITLPAAGTNLNSRVIVIQKTDVTTNAVTITPSGSETIDGQSTIALSSQFATVYLESAFGTWHLLGGNVKAGDMRLADDSTGGNLGAKNTFTGGINMKLVTFGTMTNGSTETTSYMDDTPAAEWGGVGGTADPTDTEDTSYARVGSKSLKLVWVAEAVSGDGVVATITSDNLEANESIGMWLRSSEALAAGDLNLVLTDDGGARTFSIPAVATADVWTWVEVDISSLTGGTGDAITAVSIQISTQGVAALDDFTLYVDGMMKWDAADELALGVDVLDQPGTIAGILTQVKADAGTQAHTMTALTEFTDYFIHRESGNDFIVQMSDQSANCGFGIVLHK
ncbi:MAG: hypothetical protein R3F13_13245 [Prosthecobacter sp.]